MATWLCLHPQIVPTKFRRRVGCVMRKLPESRTTQGWGRRWTPGRAEAVERRERDIRGVPTR
eukprot:6471335-Lingulodinium_polyedra.AAC.1